MPPPAAQQVQVADETEAKPLQLDQAALEEANQKDSAFDSAFEDTYVDDSPRSELADKPQAPLRAWSGDAQPPPTPPSPSSPEHDFARLAAIANRPMCSDTAGDELPVITDDGYGFDGSDEDMFEVATPVSWQPLESTCMCNTCMRAILLVRSELRIQQMMTT